MSYALIFEYLFNRLKKLKIESTEERSLLWIVYTAVTVVAVEANWSIITDHTYFYQIQIFALNLDYLKLSFSSKKNFFFRFLMFIVVKKCSNLPPASAAKLVCIFCLIANLHLF